MPRPYRNDRFIHSDKWSGGMAPFRAPMGVMRHPVKGGRWKIRKMRFPTSQGKFWMAKTEGKARRWTRSFHTQAEAVSWATFIAQVYRSYERETADAIILEYRRIRASANYIS